MAVQPKIQQNLLAALRSNEAAHGCMRVFREFDRLDVYLAGGAVRDAIIHRKEIRDFDFFLGGEDVEKAIAQLGSVGSLCLGPFGSPRWFPNENSFLYCDVIAIERFFNGLWRCEDIIDVLTQFDFTANAMAIHLSSGRFYDPINGARDSSKRIIRAVRFDYPNEPIAAGEQLTRLAVLWCRLVHYAALLDFDIDPITRAWLRQNDRFAEQISDFGRLFFPLHPEAIARWHSGFGKRS